MLLLQFCISSVALVLHFLFTTY